MKLKKYSYKITKSTNDIAIQKIKKRKLCGIVISKKQTNGRGQYGNKWLSLKGNLFMSVFFQIKRKDSIKKITKENCSLIRKAISQFIKEKITIKKPNDLLVKKQKICGILQETLIINNKKFIIVGVGLNLSNSPKIKNYPTTFLNKYTNKKVSKLMLFLKIKEMYEKKLNYLK